MLYSLHSLKSLSPPLRLARSFRLLHPQSSLPASSFSQLLAIEATSASHSFSQIVSQLELDPESNKWVCNMKVSDFKRDSGWEGPEEHEVEVRGVGETSLDATNEYVVLLFQLERERR